MKSEQTSVKEFFYDTSFSDYKLPIPKPSRFDYVLFSMLFVTIVFMTLITYEIFFGEINIENTAIEKTVKICSFLIYNIFNISLFKHIFYFIRFKKFKTTYTSSAGPR